MPNTLPAIKIRSRRKCGATIISLSHSVKSFVMPVLDAAWLKRPPAVRLATFLFLCIFPLDKKIQLFYLAV